jgi:hypothetical protein
MTGALCPTGYALERAWRASTSHYAPTTPRATLQDGDVRGLAQAAAMSDKPDHAKALDEYKAHRANCQVCGKVN